jgi:hypothetical protein
MKRSMFLLSVLFLSSLSNAADLSIVPVYNDLWDVSNGTVVTGNSQLCESAYKAKDIFGATSFSYEAGSVLFADGYAPPYIHWVEWQTPTVVTVKAFNLFAGEDYFSDEDCLRRTFSRIRLYEWDGSNWVNFFDAAPIMPYYVPVPGSMPMPFSIILPETVSSNRWRVEFDQQIWWEGGYYGPRIAELDAFATPEPMSMFLFCLGGLLLRRRNR